MAELSALDREVIELVGMTPKEAASALGISSGALRVRWGTMSKFEDNLLNDLMSSHGEVLETVERPARRSAARPVLVAAGALAVAGIGTVAVTSLGGAPDAYAVTKNADGTVTVSVRDIKAVDAANAKLQEFGIRARAVPMTDDCADLDASQMYMGDFTSPRHNGDGSVTMAPDDVPVGYTVLLAVSTRPDRGTGLGDTGPVRNPAPFCLLDPAASGSPDRSDR